MKIFFSALAFLSLPSIALSQTLCRKGEIDYFSCATDSRKIISVCGNITNDGIGDGNWLQYRFGTARVIELTYPSKKSGSASKFEGNYFNKYGVIDLRFIRGETLYGIDLNGPYSGEDTKERAGYTGGVSIEFAQSQRVNKHCKKINGEKYFEAFSHLNVLLNDYNGETDILYKFRNKAVK